MASYHAVQEELANMVQEVETSGWLIRVGDVFSNGDQVHHIRIKRIVAGEEDADDSMIYYEQFDPHTKEVLGETCGRAWYINDFWYK
ncbi:hypothetical protein QU577_26875 [Priestia megaterium]|uniref:hypothetical protein n=1 Tax=Priestia megaterium TaxID=1404 RepID=UPI0025AF20BF|nr:hypothetical protein [Priestia megaterium]MDN3365390.1 hypothetical protein [Priestia megaterium]